MSPSSRGNPSPLFIVAFCVLLGLAGFLFWQRYGDAAQSDAERRAARTATADSNAADPSNGKRDAAAKAAAGKRHSGLDDPNVEIFGSVVDERARQPKAGIPVLLLGENQKTTLQTVVSDQQGTFSIRAVLHGEYWLAAGAAEGSSLDNDGRGYPLVVERDTQRLGPVTLVLKDRARLEVQAVDAVSSRPITNALFRAAQHTVLELPADEQGGAVFNLPEGIATVQAEAPGYALGQQQIQLRRDRPNRVTLRLARGAAAFGTVYDPNGVGRAEVTVRFWQQRHKFEALSDEQGAYRIENLRVGEPFEVELLVGEQLTARPGIYTIPNRKNEAEFNFRLPENNYPLKYAVVNGVVLDDAGTPINDALIEFFLGSGATYATRSNRNGQFELQFEHNSLSTRIKASAPGYADNVQKNVALLLTEEHQSVRIVLGPGNTASGQVVREDDGAGMAGVPILVQSHDEILGDGNWLEVARSGLNGAFELDGLPPSYRIKAEQGGLRSQPLGPFDGDQVDLLLPLTTAFLLDGQVVDAANNEPITNFELRVLPVGTQTYRGDWSNQQDHGWEPYQNGLRISDDAGLFTVKGVPHTDRFKVEIIAEGFAKAEADQNDFTQTLEQDGALVHYEHLFRMKRERPIIAGKVLNEQGNPLNKAWVMLAESEGTPAAPAFWPQPGAATGSGFRATQTTGAGAFRFDNVFSNQNLAIAVFFDGKVRYHRNMSEFNTESWSRLSLQITPLSTIEVTVQREDFPNAVDLQVLQQGAVLDQIAVPVGEGLFQHTFTNLMGDSYEVRLTLDRQAGGPPMIQQPAHVTHKNPAKVVFQDNQSAFLRGEVLMDGEPYRNLPVILLSFPRLSPVETTTNSAGRFSIENLKTGSYSLFAPGRMRVQAMDYSAQREYLDIPAEGLERQFSFRSMGSVTGRIAGCPVSQVMIIGRAEAGNQINVTASLEADGRFFANNLPKGEYSVYGDCPPNNKEQLYPLTEPFAIISEDEAIDLGEVEPVDYAHLFLKLVTARPHLRTKGLSVIVSDAGGRILAEKRATVGDRAIYLGGFNSGAIQVEVIESQGEPMRAEPRVRSLNLQAGQTMLLEIEIIAIAP